MYIKQAFFLSWHFNFIKIKVIYYLLNNRVRQYVAHLDKFKLKNHELHRFCFHSRYHRTLPSYAAIVWLDACECVYTHVYTHVCARVYTPTLPVEHISHSSLVATLRSPSCLAG